MASNRNSEPPNIVIVGGCGRAGLPLGLAFAAAGARVHLLDIDPAKVEQVNRGKVPFLETNGDETLRALPPSRLTATLDERCLVDAQIAITIIGTPVDEHLNPTTKDFYRVVDGIIRHLRKDALLVLRSTLCPGVSRLVYQRLDGTGLDLAYCPERIAEGNALEELRRLPQIIS